MAEEYHTCCSRAVPKIPFNRVFCLLFFRLVKTRLERSSHKLYVIPDAGFQSVLVSVSILFCRVFVFHLSVFADFFFSFCRLFLDVGTGGHYDRAGNRTSRRAGQGDQHVCYARQGMVRMALPGNGQGDSFAL